MTLQGRSVIVTRPEHQSAALCSELQRAGARALSLPLLAIDLLPVSDTQQGADYDWLIFTSSNAVMGGADLLRQQPHSRLAAVGAATAVALKKADAREVRLPVDNFSSEGLLASDMFQDPRGQHILLVKGEGGRTLLTDTLRQRGAQVDELPVYRRRPLTPEPEIVERALRQADSVIITSGEILQQLFDLTPTPLVPRLRELQLVVPSKRVVQMALLLGFCHVHCVQTPLDDAALVQALEMTRPQASSSGQKNA